jgi:photosystem II stability/assembly factor-like uncharacterized protein
VRTLLLGAVTATVVLAAAGAALGMPAANTAWEWQNPSPHGDDITSVVFTSDVDLWAVGATRGFLHSADGGITWTANRLGPPMGFNAIAFADADNAWAVGQPSDGWDYMDRALMYHSADGGATWTEAPVSLAANAPLGDIAFADPDQGWAVGRYGTILHTSDGGANWTLQHVPAEVSSMDFLKATFTSADDGWAVGDRSGNSTAIVRTTDGGSTWHVVYNESVSLWTVAARDAHHAWAAGEDLEVYTTGDDGVTWDQADTPAPEGFESISDIEVVDATTGLACTKSGSKGGRILRTIDAGATWTVVESGLAQGLDDLSVRGQTVMAAGQDGLLLVSADGGATWTDLSSGSREFLGSISFVDKQRGWIAGYGGVVLQTGDGGTTWTSSDTGTSANLGAVDFVDASYGWIVGAGGLIKRTSDGGASWRTQKSGRSGGIGGVDFVSRKRGWAVGESGMILRTTDGGSHWLAARSGVKWNIAAVQFLDATYGWAVGDEGVLRTRDGGKTWAVSHPRRPWKGSGNAIIEGLCFIDRREGWVSGFAPTGIAIFGTVFHTTDGGRTWTAQGPTSSKGVVDQDVADVAFSDRLHGWGVGYNGLLIWTRDGGVTWQFADRPVPDEFLVGIEMLDAQVGFTVGSGGTVLKTTSGGH